MLTPQSSSSVRSALVVMEGPMEEVVAQNAVAEAAAEQQRGEELGTSSDRDEQGRHVRSDINLSELDAIALRPHIEEGHSNALTSYATTSVDESPGKQSKASSIVQAYWHKHRVKHRGCLLYTSPSPRDRTRSRMPSSA